MSTAGNNYEAWKESQIQAEAAGDVDWSVESAPVSSWVGLSSIVEMKGVWAGLLIGAGLLIAGIALLAPNSNYLTWGTRTVGTIVGHKDYYRRSNIVAPIVRYSAPGGVYDFVGWLSVDRSIYPAGKEVSVLYLPNDPRKAVIGDFVQIFMLPTVVGGLGLICLSVTGGFMFVVIRCELPPDTTGAFSTPQRKIPPATSTPQTVASAASATCGGGNALES